MRIGVLMLWMVFLISITTCHICDGQEVQWELDQLRRQQEEFRQEWQDQQWQQDWDRRLREQYRRMEEDYWEMERDQDRVDQWRKE